MDAEIEKLELLREHRSVKEKFYSNLAILSGGTLAAIVTLADTVVSISGNTMVKRTLTVAVVFSAISFVLSLLRNNRASEDVKSIAQNESVKDRKTVIIKSSKESNLVNILSWISVVCFVLSIGLFAYAVIIVIL